MKKLTYLFVCTLLLILGACAKAEAKKATDQSTDNTTEQNYSSIRWKELKNITFVKSMKIPAYLPEKQIGITDAKGIAFEFQGGMFTAQKMKHNLSFENYVASKEGLLFKVEPVPPDKEPRFDTTESIDIKKYPELEGFDAATMFHGKTEKLLLLIKKIDEQTVLEVYFEIPNGKYSPVIAQAVYQMASSIQY